MSEPLQLFEIGAEDVALTSDDWYTPRWLFDAADLVFDMDVCAPVNPAFRTCPARSYMTVVEDGLAQPWDGLVWMNPPYSKPGPWINLWVAHPAGLALLPAYRDVPWVGKLLLSADAIALLSIDFVLANGQSKHTWSQSILAARGDECVQALARVAAADRFAAGAYHVRPTTVTKITPPPGGVHGGGDEH